MLNVYDVAPTLYPTLRQLLVLAENLRLAADSHNLKWNIQFKLENGEYQGDYYAKII